MVPVEIVTLPAGHYPLCVNHAILFLRVGGSKTRLINDSGTMGKHQSRLSKALRRYACIYVYTQRRESKFLSIEVGEKLVPFHQGWQGFEAEDESLMSESYFCEF